MGYLFCNLRYQGNQRLEEIKEDGYWMKRKKFYRNMLMIVAVLLGVSAVYFLMPGNLKWAIVYENGSKDIRLEDLDRISVMNMDTKKKASYDPSAEEYGVILKGKEADYGEYQVEIPVCHKEKDIRQKVKIRYRKQNNWYRTKIHTKLSVKRDKKEYLDIEVKVEEKGQLQKETFQVDKKVALSGKDCEIILN